MCDCCQDYGSKTANELALKIKEAGEFEEFYQKQKNGYMQDFHKGIRLKAQAEFKAEKARIEPPIFVPELNDGSGSWIVTNLKDGKAVGEFYARSIVEKINSRLCKVETAMQYLCRFNAEIKAQVQAS